MLEIQSDTSGHSLELWQSHARIPLRARFFSVLTIPVLCTSCIYGDPRSIFWHILETHPSLVFMGFSVLIQAASAKLGSAAYLHQENAGCAGRSVNLIFLIHISA